jgi:hypothetical protein
MQSTETKGLEEKLDDETSVSAGFSGIKKRDLLLLRDKPVSLDPQLLDFRVQRRAGNSQFRCIRSITLDGRPERRDTGSLSLKQSVNSAD